MEPTSGSIRTTQMGVNGATGFHMIFSNGNTISVQWGPFSYTKQDRWDPETPEGKFQKETGGKFSFSSTAEIAAWDSEQNWHYFKDGNTVQGYTSVDEVAYFIGWVSTHTLNTKDPLKEIEEHEHV